MTTPAEYKAMPFSGLSEPTADDLNAEPLTDPGSICGKPVFFWYTGPSYWQFAMWCGNYRECKVCWCRRFDDWTDRLYRIRQLDDVIAKRTRIVLVNEKQTRRLKRLLGRHQYWAIPHTYREDERWYIMIYFDRFYALGRYPQQEPNILKWIDAQPVGSRISGALGKELKHSRKRSDAPRYPCLLLSTPGTPGKVVREIIESTDLPSPDGLPVEEYHRLCQNAHIQALESAGVKVKTYNRDAALTTQHNDTLTRVDILRDTEGSNE